MFDALSTVFRAFSQRAPKAVRSNGNNGAGLMTGGGSPLFGQWGGPYGDEVNPPPNLLADFDYLVKRHSWADLVKAGRDIYARYSIVAGAVHDKATTVVGDAWDGIFTGKDSDWGNKAKAWLDGWMKICDVRGGPFTFWQDVWIGSCQLDHSGDFGLMLVNGPDGYPLIQPFECHRIGYRAGGMIATGRTTVNDGPFKGRTVANGIVLNEYARAIGYGILGDDPDLDEIIERPDFLHCYDPLWYSQSRGVPCLSFGMDDWHLSERVKSNEAKAQEILSALTIIEENQTGRPDPAAERIRRRPIEPGGDNTTGEGKMINPPPLFVEKFAKGMIRYIRAGMGNSVKASEHNRPNTGYFQHHELVIQGAFLGMDWPMEWVLKTEKLGRTPGRAITDRVNRSARARQSTLKHVFLPVIIWAIAKAIKLKLLEPNDEWFMWDLAMPAEVTVDDNYQRESQREDLLAGLDSHTAVCARRGQRFERVIEQKAKDEKLIEDTAKKYGLDPVKLRQTTPNASSEPEKNGKGKKKEEKTKEDEQ